MTYTQVVALRGLQAQVADLTSQVAKGQEQLVDCKGLNSMLAKERLHLAVRLDSAERARNVHKRDLIAARVSRRAVKVVVSLRTWYRTAFCAEPSWRHSVCSVSCCIVPAL